FLYFTDHEPGLGRLVTEGRRKEFASFAAFQDPARREQIPDPQAETTFLRSRLNFAERQTNAGIYRLHRELLALRRTDPVFRNADRQALVAEAIGDRCVVLRRWTGDEPAQRRVVVANFGTALDRSVSDTPSLGWLADGHWRILLSTSSRRFNGAY